MKKFLKLVLVLFLMTIVFVACKKDKGQTQTDSNQPQTVQNYDYEKILYVNEAKFNVSGDLIVLFSEELDKNQDFKKLIEVEGLDNGDITIMPFINKIIIKGNFQKEVPYSVKVSQGIKGVSGTTLMNDFFKNNIYVDKKQPSLSFIDSGNVLPSINNKKINFNSVNVKKVKLEIVKVYTNNITHYLKLYSNEYGVNEWELKGNLEMLFLQKSMK